MRNNRTALMTEGAIPKQIFLFAVPLILGNLLQQLYNTADSIIVGNFVGSNALAAVGSSTSMVNLLIAFSQGASVGAGVIVSQYLGANNKKSVQQVVHTAIVMALILGTFLTIGGVFAAKPLLLWMNTPDDVLADSVTYLQIYFGGVLFNVLYNMASGILNAAGNTKRSLLYLGYASITNIILDIILVEVCDMGVAGAAIATDISQLVSSILAIVYLTRIKADYRIQLNKIRIHKVHAMQIIRVGLPAGIQNMVISFSNVLVQASVNGFGAAAMAGFGAYMKIDGFNILPVMSFSMASTTFTGQNYGAGKANRVKRGMWVTLTMCICYTILTGILLFLFSDPLMRLFSSDTSVIAYGEQAFHHFCPWYFALGILQALSGSIRGLGKGIPPMVIQLLSLCLFRIGWVQLVLPLFDSISGIYLMYPVSWILGVFLTLMYMWKGHPFPSAKTKDI